MSGRKSDVVWLKFDKIATKTGIGCKARCKSCHKEIQGLVAWMKAHVEKCNEDTVMGKCKLHIITD
jgi:hypothetical protein